MPINNSSDVHQKLLYLAIVRQQSADKIAPLQQQIDLLTVQLKQQRQYLDEAERQVRDDILDYMQSTGDLHAHPHVTFRRTQKLVYDKDDIIRYGRSHCPEVIRVKEELDVKAFEKLWKEGKLAGAQVEVVNAPTLEIGKLGDLLINQEAKNEQ